MSRRPGRAVTAAVAVLGLAASACSGADDGVTADSAAPDAPASSAPATPPPATTGEAVGTTSPSGATATSAPAPSTTTAPFEVAPLEWEACDEATQAKGIPECATLTVPRDHTDPAGEQIEIAVARIDTADDDEQIGSLVLNPGGPGGSGLLFLAQAALTIPEAVQERFDLVGFDPRGVGASSAVECDVAIDDQILLVPAADDAAWEALVGLTEEQFTSCDPASQELAQWVGTNNAARDLDLLRAALGDEQLTYVGYSYGTRLGATYAELFPDRVRALVLDGAVKPSTELSALNADQAGGFDRAFTNFAAACDADEDCLLRELGPTIEVVQGLRAEIAEVGSFPTDDPGRVLTLGELTLAVLAALYSQDAWPFLVQGLYVAEVSQDGSILQALADSYVGRRPDGTYDNSSEANTAINCADDATRRTEAEERAASDATAARSTYFADALRAGAGCLFREPALDPLILGPAAGAPPILVVGTTGDPATPYEWAVELADFLDSGVLYSVEGEGHTAYGSIDCVAEVVDAYLIDLEVPEPGGSCADEASDDVFVPVGESEIEQVAAFLTCLRENGVDIPEIGVDDLLADPYGETFADALDPTDPDFGDAALACQDLITF